MSVRKGKGKGQVLRESNWSPGALYNLGSGG